MADISQMNVNGTTYNIKDTVARASGVPSGGNTNQVLAKNSNSDYDLKWVNQSGGGGVGTVVNLTTTTTSFHNKTVTLTGTYATYTATFDSTGHASVNVYYVGTYDIACEGFHNSVNVTAMGLVLTQGIDEDYCTVNITTSIADLEGETIDIYYGTDPTDIRAQLTFDSSLALSFRATQIGDYNIAWASASPQTFTVSALSGSMSVTYTPIPIGASATPVNDIRTWLNCAAIFNKNYTTISQVLSDTTTLQTLISSNNANDYLVRSTSWVSDVCGNSTAMSYIGLNNYSANTLLADSTWCTGICNSTFFEYVLNVKVPTMTSNTTPSGECFASTSYGTNFDAYRAFDNDITSGWNCAQSEYDQTNKAYVGYDFSSKLQVYKVYYWTGEYNKTPTSSEWRVIASNDKTTWTEISSTQSVNNTTLIIQRSQKYRYYALRGSDYIVAQTNLRYAYVNTLQFYGRRDV